MMSEPMTSLPGDDVAVSLQEHIGIIEIRRPPDNLFDVRPGWCKRAFRQPALRSCAATLPMPEAGHRRGAGSGDRRRAWPRARRRLSRGGAGGTFRGQLRQARHSSRIWYHRNAAAGGERVAKFVFAAEQQLSNVNGSWLQMIVIFSP